METREGTLDDFIVKEVKSYLNKFKEFKDTDVVLDLWGNIWAFTALIAPKVSKVITFEPDEENFSLLLNNTKEFNNVIPLKEAVVWNDDTTRSFFLNTKTNKGSHSFLVQRWRDEVTVSCVNFNTILEEYKPNKIKMDIEGWEYELLTTAIDLSFIDEIVIEYHFNALRDKDKTKYKEVIEILKNHFKNVEYKEDTKKAWCTIITANNY